MSMLIKIQENGHVTIPNRIRSKAGLIKDGLVEAEFEHGRIVLTPKPVVAHSKVANAGGGHTPSQRRIIDAQLADGLADVKAGRVHGPFSTHKEFTALLHKEAKKLSRKKIKLSA